MRRVRIEVPAADDTADANSYDVIWIALVGSRGSGEEGEDASHVEERERVPEPLVVRELPALGCGLRQLVVGRDAGLRQLGAPFVVSHQGRVRVVLERVRRTVDHLDHHDAHHDADNNPNNNPNGDSNGCMSIKDYDRFLQAFLNGEVKRVVVRG